MKSTLTYIFILLYIVAMLRPIAPLVEYVVYEDYIAEFLCINKEKQELECNGKCYLMERLSEQNDQKQQNLPRIVLEEYPIGFVEFLSFTIDDEMVSASSSLSFYNNNYSFIYSSSDFHPPNKAC